MGEEKGEGTIIQHRTCLKTPDTFRIEVCTRTRASSFSCFRLNISSHHIRACFHPASTGLFHDLPAKFVGSPFPMKRPETESRSAKRPTFSCASRCLCFSACICVKSILLLICFQTCHHIVTQVQIPVKPYHKVTLNSEKKVFTPTKIRFLHLYKCNMHPSSDFVERLELKGVVLLIFPLFLFSFRI